MKDTGEEEILFEDHNVITGGLGRSIAQFMSLVNCVDPPRELCPELMGSDYPIGLPNLTNSEDGGSTTAPRLPTTTAKWHSSHAWFGDEGQAKPMGGATLGFAVGGLGSFLTTVSTPSTLKKSPQAGIDFIVE